MEPAVAALIAKAKREIQHHFFSADAVRADRAVTFTPANGLEARQFARLLKLGAIRQEAGDRYWIDVVVYDIIIQQRYRFVRNTLMALSAVLAVLLLVPALTD